MPFFSEILLHKYTYKARIFLFHFFHWPPTLTKKIFLDCVCSDIRAPMQIYQKGDSICVVLSETIELFKTYFWEGKKIGIKFGAKFISLSGFMNVYTHRM